MHDPGVAPPVSPGDVLAGKYRVQRVLGVGGMGVVVEALHLELDQRVAVKFLLPHAIGSPESAARFVREARAAVKINSEHVARVIDVGRLETGAPYIVMEYLEGSDLAAIVQHGPQPLEEVVEYVLQTCEAMADAHAAGIVHRDLKPSNLFLTRRSDGSHSIKVLDFGISKVTQTGTPDPSLTKTSALMGSPLYMSPEQLRSARTVDHRTDIWSLGVIVFELLTGTTPFMAETLPQLIATILTEEPLRLGAKRPDLPAEVERIVMKTLEKDPERRFRNVGELALALAPFAPRRSRYTTERILRVSGLDVPSSNDPVNPPAAAASVSTGSTTGTRTHDVWSGTRSMTKSGSPLVPLLLAGVIVAIAGAVAAVFFLRPTSGEPPVTRAVDTAKAETPPVHPSPPPPAPAAVAPTTEVHAAAPVVSVAPVEKPMPTTAEAAKPPASRPPSPAKRPVPTRDSKSNALAEPSPAVPPPKPLASPAPPPAQQAQPKTPKNPLTLDLK